MDKVKIYLSIVIISTFLLLSSNLQAQCNKPINPKGVGCIETGISFTAIEDKYDVKKEFVVGDEGGIEPFVSLNNYSYVLSLEYDSEYGYQTTIDDIYVLTNKAKTDRGIGVGSTVVELIQKYPDIEAGYSYIAAERGFSFLNGAQLTTKSLPNITFIVDLDHYSRDVKIEGDWISLNPKEFTLAATIKCVSIRKPFGL